MMVELLIALAVAWPLVVMLRNPLRLMMEQDGLWRPGQRPQLLDGVWVTAPLPALLLALWPGEGALLLDGWLLGGLWQLDETRRPWLAFSALLWLLAGAMPAAIWPPNSRWRRPVTEAPSAACWAWRCCGR